MKKKTVKSIFYVIVVLLVVIIGIRMLNNHGLISFNVSGTKGLEYSLNEDGTSYSVVGIGSATEEEIVVAKKYNGKPVTIVGEDAFKNCNITSVVLQKGITHIDNRAFYGCEKLETVDVPDTLMSVAWSAFKNCPKLKYREDNNLLSNNVYLGNKNNKYILLIGGESLDYINSKTKVIVDEAFMYRPCSSDGVYLTATYVGKYSFAYSGISKIWGAGTKSIGDFAFSDCANLYEFDVGSDLVIVNKNAFNGCDNLQYTEYGNAKYLGNKNNPYYLLVSAIDDNCLSCEIHKDTKCIAGNAFSDCRNLLVINFDGSKDQWSKIAKNKLWFDSKAHSFNAIRCTNGELEIVD